MRIKGLVRASNKVRAQLRSGVSPRQIQQLRIQVDSLIQAVEGMCARRGLTPGHLPTPSRNAYQFLKRLDLDDLPPRDVVRYLEPAKPLAIRNLVKIGNHIADQLWQESQVPAPGSGEEDKLLTDIQQLISHVERTCQEKDSTPSALAAPSRRVYCWLKFLSTQDRISLHTAALVRMATVLPSVAKSVKHPVRIHMVNMSALWRVRHHEDTILVAVNEGFLNAGPEVCEAIVLNCLDQRTRARNRIIRVYAASDEFGEVLFGMDAYAVPEIPRVQGNVHNLEESFDRVNKAYFGGIMSKPRLVWSDAPTTRKLGHYRQNLDTVMLSVTLDDTAAPPFLVDLVMYHELLHKKHGFKIANGRVLAHSRLFREDEKRFANYDEVMASLGKLTRRRV